MAKNWTHKVVKKQLGGDGKWFPHRAAGTFVGVESAMTYAKEFATEQRAAGVSGTRIVVIARKGERTIASYNVNRGDVTEALRNADLSHVGG